MGSPGSRSPRYFGLREPQRSESSSAYYNFPFARLPLSVFCFTLISPPLLKKISSNSHPSTLTHPTPLRSDSKVSVKRVFLPCVLAARCASPRRRKVPRESGRTGGAEVSFYSAKEELGLMVPSWFPQHPPLLSSLFHTPLLPVFSSLPLNSPHMA